MSAKEKLKVVLAAAATGVSDFFQSSECLSEIEKLSLGSSDLNLRLSTIH